MTQDDQTIIAAKQIAHAHLHNLASDGDVKDAYHTDAHLWASHPFNKLQGHDAINGFWQQLRTALPDLERRDSIFTGGYSKPDARMDARIDDNSLTGRLLIATMGNYQGTFTQDLCGIPATNGVVNIRSCEVHHMVDDRIAHSYMLIDLLDLMRQAGVWPIAPSLGAEGAWQPPSGGAGIRLDQQDSAAGDIAFNTVIDMHNALLTFDGKSLDSMQHGAYWGASFLWYGPAGIGTTRGMDGFRAHHQIPFLTGFPDRQGAGHYIRIGDGNFVVTGGWPSVTGTHTGEWLGLPATGKHVEMRVMDFYHLVNGKITENWVPIDILYILYQMGFDVFARLQHLRGNPRRDL
ncbi:MAG: ester cyclase [Candidatus Puniceispirillum sp.]